LVIGKPFKKFYLFFKQAVSQKTLQKVLPLFQTGWLSENPSKSFTSFSNRPSARKPFKKFYLFSK